MSTKRDYSDVQWPWEGDPNWGPPREGATSIARDQKNWTLACGECGLYFPYEDMQIGVVADHYQGHFEEDTGGKVKLNLVWIGLGTPPQPPKKLI